MFKTSKDFERGLSDHHKLVSWSQVAPETLQEKRYTDLIKTLILNALMLL